MDNILLETSVCWLSEDIVNFEIKVGVYKKFAKNATVISLRNHHLAARCSKVMICITIALPFVHFLHGLGYSG